MCWLKGRLVSDRGACVEQRDVYLVADDSTADYPEITYVATTDGDGRWSVGDRSAHRGATTTVFALTLGDASCRVAQSRSLSQQHSRTVTFNP